jgi:hypothetical protein
LNEQALFLLIYRERQKFEILRCSVRKLSCMLPSARKPLAQVLDRMDIL